MAKFECNDMKLKNQSLQNSVNKYEAQVDSLREDIVQQRKELEVKDMLKTKVEHLQGQLAARDSQLSKDEQIKNLLQENKKFCKRHQKVVDKYTHFKKEW